MCCNASKIGTTSLREKMLLAGGKMVFWKIIKNDGFSQIYDYHKWSVGTHKADSFSKPKFPKNEFYQVRIDAGIHVYVNKPSAIKELREFRDDGGVSYVLLEVTCDVKDLLGSEGLGWDFATAVFSQVEVTPKSWTKMKKCKSDYYLKRVSL